MSFQSCRQTDPSFFQRSDGVGAGHAGEVFEKLAETPLVLQVVSQGLEGNSRPPEHRLAAENRRIADDNGRSHFFDPPFQSLAHFRESHAINPVAFVPNFLI